MKMKKLLICLCILLVPFVAGAAYNDVTLTTDTTVTVGGYNFSVSGFSAVVESITVDANTLSFVLLTNSQIQFTSTDRIFLSGTGSSEIKVVNTCTASDAVSVFLPVAASSNVTVTVGSSACTVPTTSTSNTSGSSSGRGGGGGGGTTLPITPATPNPALPALIAAAPQAAFNRGLSVGSTGDDVRNLQTRLLSEGFFKGEATGYFGPITQKAVKAYQAKYGINQLGIVGPATRAQLNKIFMANPASNASATTGLTSAQISAITAQINTLLQQVQELQAKLKALGN